jgi:hypothetical protein
MLGSVQALVEIPAGLRLGYSGDCSWPLPVRPSSINVAAVSSCVTSSRSAYARNFFLTLLEMVLLGAEGAAEASPSGDPVVENRPAAGRSRPEC